MSNPTGRYRIGHTQNGWKLMAVASSTPTPMGMPALSFMLKHFDALLPAHRPRRPKKK